MQVDPSRLMQCSGTTVGEHVLGHHGDGFSAWIGPQVGTAACSGSLRVCSPHSGSKGQVEASRPVRYAETLHYLDAKHFLEKLQRSDEATGADRYRFTRDFCESRKRVGCVHH